MENDEIEDFDFILPIFENFINGNRKDAFSAVERVSKVKFFLALPEWLCQRFPVTWEGWYVEFSHSFWTLSQ